MTEACCYCRTTSQELRPYGPEGAPVCHPCATSPEHKEQTQAAFEAVVRAAVAMSPIGSVVLDADGIHPQIPEGLA
jgi:hypothetical protein